MSVTRLFLVSLLALTVWGPAFGQDFKKLEARIAEYNQWLNQLRSTPRPFWVRLESNRRPHRLYVGEGFYAADQPTKERFVEIFSHTIAGHPEKFMLLDIFDAVTGLAVGEFGWGGFKLYPNGPSTPNLQVQSNLDVH
jgi:hypothetical protein